MVVSQHDQVYGIVISIIQRANLCLFVITRVNALPGQGREGGNVQST